MGKSHSKRKSDKHQAQETIDIEKTNEPPINEKDEYKEKYESCNRKCLQMKSQLTKALQTVKSLERQLAISEENSSALYLRYAIETDLNKRLRKSQERIKEDERLEMASRHSQKFSTNSETMKRFENIEERIFLLECRLNISSIDDTL